MATAANGGVAARERLLPDLLIGAHAYAEGWTLLSRDGPRHRTDFAELRLITP